MKQHTIFATTAAMTALGVALFLAGPQAAQAAGGDIDVTGTVGDVPFPDRDRSYMTKGDFINIDNLRRMRAGLSKDQVRLLLGNPHFSEGLGGVREWNYIFNFRTGNGDEFITCQYQVRYDKQDGGYRAKSLHWDGPDCMALANKREAPPMAIDPPPTASGPQRFSLETDALFRFGRSGTEDILPDGRERLAAVADHLGKAKPASVRVIGHTDPIGSDASNQVLSERRAETVRDYLVAQGVRGDVSAEGRGEREQVKSCGNQSRASLIACLVPNRRVELVVEGMR